MRIFTFLTIICALIACNSEVKVSATAEDLDNLVSQKTKPPVFKDSTISSYVSEYNTFIENYLLAVKSKDSKKIKNLQKQSEELIEKAKIVSGKLTTPAQLQRYQNWMHKQQEKIQLLNNIK